MDHEDQIGQGHAVLSSSGGSPDAKPQPAPRVLVVDDSASIRRSVEVFLGSLPVAMAFAADGYEALRVIACEPLPSLILADVLMPRISGYQLCSLVKSNQRTRSVPFYVLSSKDGEVDQAYAELAGVDGYLVKPFQKADLQAIVKSVLGLNKGAAQSAVSAGGGREAALQARADRPVGGSSGARLSR